MDSNERQLALDVLRQDDPDAHHLICPEIVVERTGDIEIRPSGDGRSTATLSWVITCPHGSVSDVSLMAVLRTKRPESGEVTE